MNVEFQRWILDHISARQSFAIETILRSPITFEQSRLAREYGFWTAMNYVATGSVEESIRRIIERSHRGGHSASERLVRKIYEKSTKNLFTALDFGESGVEVVRIYDNSEVGGHARQRWAVQVLQVISAYQLRRAIRAHNCAAHETRREKNGCPPPPAELTAVRIT